MVVECFIQMFRLEPGSVIQSTTLVDILSASWVRGFDRWSGRYGESLGLSPGFLSVNFVRQLLLELFGEALGEIGNK
jgi:hypothetical protein